ncbi:MAG: CHASE2 domain-containing protein [bacterium]
MKIRLPKLPRQAEKRNPIVGVLLGAASAVVLGACFHDAASKAPIASALYDLMHNFEYKTYDLRFLIRGPLDKKSISPDIVLLDYDDETQEWAPFPPDRNAYAEIIRAFSGEESRTRATFFDVFFFDPFGQQLNNDMALVLQDAFADLPGAVNADVELTARVKEKMYNAAQLLKSGAVDAAAAELGDVVSDENMDETIGFFDEAALFFSSNADMRDIAPNRDALLHDAISGAGNVYLAQIVNNAEKTPYDADDVIFDPAVHGTFAKLVRMRDRTQTESRIEVLVNYTLRNLTVGDYERILRDSAKKSVGNRRPLKFSKEERRAIREEMRKVREDVEKAMEMNGGLGVDVPPGAPVNKEKLFGKYRNLINITAPARFIAEGAAGIGYVKPEFQEYDGTIRTAAPMSVFLDRLYLHVDMLLAMLYLGVEKEDLVFHENRIVMKNCRFPGAAKPGTVTIPLFRNGTVLVNWAGNFYEPDQFTHRSFRKIYESAVKYNILKKYEKGEAPLNPVERRTLAAMSKAEIEKVRKDISFFKGKISMTGLTAEGTHDLNPIPFHPRYPLVGMHANFVNMILNGLFIRTTPFIAFFLALAALSVFVGYMAGAHRQLPGALICGGAVAAWAALSVAAFVFARLWVPFVPVVVTLVAAYLFVLVYRFMTEGHEARRMKGMFATYVNPSVVDTLIHNPDMLRLGGERMDLTAMFALAAGPGVESDDAEALVERLNEYFTAMTDQIFAHDGTLDKYEGKIIMAIYGAPVHFEDHHVRACLSCVGMKNAMRELHEKWKNEGREPIFTTVGLNSGPMIAGNMGSASRFNYTVMGDSVNLAARILGASIQYGINFMISETTYDGAKEKIIGRLVDSIVVVGKEEPANVYEIIAARDDRLPDDVRRFIETYERGFALYQQRKWDEAIEAFAAALELKKGDKPSMTLLERCRFYKTSPPDDRWRGEFVLTAKGL